MKFALIAVRIVGDATFEGAIEFAPGLEVAPRSPFELGRPWNEWLGSDAAEVVTRGNLFVMSSRDSTSPDVLDTESRSLAQNASCAWWAILLCGVPRVLRVLQLQGSVQEGSHETRSVGRLEVPTLPRLVYPADLDNESLRRARAVARGLIQVDGGRSDFIRLRRGFKALRSALHETDGGETIHQSIRALEALIKPEHGNTKPRLSSRTEHLLGPSHHALIAELCDLRNQVEHMNEIVFEMAEGLAANEEELAAIRVFQARRLACEAYERVLSSPGLLQHFCTDRSIDEFWSMEVERREKVWGPPFKLDKEVRDQLSLRANIERHFQELARKGEGGK